MTGENPAIGEVENNLLPPVLIEGERPYKLQDRMAYYNIPGVSIAVIKDFKVEWVKHYGMRDADLGEPVTDSTLFCVGSLSKAVAAATILHLVDQGKCRLNDKANDYLKSWRVPDNEFTAKAEVTIQRLLNHSSGFLSLPGHSFAPDKMPSLIQYLSAEPPLNIPPARVVYEPGTAFLYSNAGYSVLQILVEDITGETYQEYAQRIIFEPLGMTYSSLEMPLSPEKAHYASAGHRRDRTVGQIKQYAYPSLTAGGLWSTAEEYAKFVIEIQRTLKGESDRIMSQELAQQMTSPHEAKEYGYGVFMRYTDEVTYFGHIGDFNGFVAGFTAHPTDGYGVVVMTNNNNGISLVREIMWSVAKVYDWQSILPVPHALYKLEPETMRAYAGRYRLSFDEVCELYEQNGTLVYRAPDLQESRLYPISKDTLVSKEHLGQLVFALDSDGKVASCYPRFADEIGRFPSEATKAVRMVEGEKTPLEMLIAGDIDVALASYKDRKAKLPDDPNVSERRFNSLGYQLLGQEKVTEALAVFKLNTELYPQSGNCWDSYAEALLAAGNKEEALRNYKKALELDPMNANAERWIEKLQTDG